MSRKQTSQLETSVLEELLEFLQRANRQEDGKNLLAVLGHMAIMEKQLQSVSEQLLDVQQELAKQQEPGPAATEYKNLADRLQSQLKAAQKQLDSLMEKFTESVKNAVDAVKKSGLSALNGAMDFLEVKKGLVALSGRLRHAAVDAHNTKDNITAASQEYHEVGKHLRNFGRTIQGKQPLEQARPEGKLSKGAQSFFAGVHNVLMGTAKDARKAAGLLDQLEQSVEKNKEKKESLTQNLQKQKAEQPPPAAGKTLEAEPSL